MSASGFGPRPGASASSALIATHYAHFQDLLFFSEYYFYPEGVKDVIDQFEHALHKADLDADPQWVNSTCMFKVKCNRGEIELVSPLFTQAMQAVINGEEEANGIHNIEGKYDDDDSACGSTFDDDFQSDIEESKPNEGEPIKSTKIQRLDVWKANNKPGGLASSFQLSSDPGDVQYPSRINQKSIKGFWSCGSDLAVIIPDHIITLLEELTECDIVRDLNRGQIFIGGDSERNVHLAVLKLDNIRKYSKDIIPCNAHVFYTEQTEIFKLSLNYIIDVKISNQKRMYQTTLLDKLDLHEMLKHRNNTYENLYRAITVRCAALEKNDYIVPRIIKASPMTKQSQSLDSLHWARFTYSSKGNPADNPLRYFDNQTSFQPKAELPDHETLGPVAVHDQSDANIRAWADSVPTIDLFSSQDFFVAATPLDGHPPRAPVNPQKPSWDTAEMYNQDTETLTNMERLALAQKAQNSNVKKSLPARNVQDSRSAQGISTRGKSSQVNNAQNDQSGTARPASGTSGTSALSHIHISVPTKSPAPPATLSTNAIISQPDPFDELEIALNSPINGNPPSHTKSSSPPEDLIDLSDPGVPSLTTRASNPAAESSGVTELLGSIDEVDTRRFHNTMNQKQPKRKDTAAQKTRPSKVHLPLPSPPRSHPRSAVSEETSETFKLIPEFLRDMNLNFKRLLGVNRLRGFRGRITVCVEFGRILVRNINPNFIASKEGHQPLECQKVLEILGYLPYSGHKQAQVDFTNKLTTMPDEIRYLVNMGSSTGDPLWNQNPSHWEVKYEFIFSDKAKTWAPLTVEMDAETFDTDLTVPQDFGSIYVHGTKRAWDFRIVAFGREHSEYIEERYGELAKTLKKSLYIPTDSRTARLTFELPQRLVEKFDVISIRVHRSTHHSSTERDSYLKVDEVQDLFIRARYKLPIGEGMRVFDAFPYGGEGETLEGIPNWIEVSIHSEEIEYWLAANPKLQLGDEAGWSPENFSKINAAQELYLPACEMLRQMDGVGYHNDNGLNVQNALSARLNGNGSQYPLPPGWQGFW